MLPKLVSAANRERHDLAFLESLFLPHDARPGVLVRWGENLYRMLPGSMDYPLGVVDTLRLLAEVIDPVLMEHLRFGLADVVELILRRVDHVASVMAPTWSGRQERSEAPPRISRHEFAAAGTLMDISHQVASCQNPDRAQRALEFFSVRPKRLRLNSSGMEASFGATLAVRTGSGLVVLPAGMLVDALGDVGRALAEKACLLDRKVEERWEEAVKTEVHHAMAGAGYLFAVQEPPGVDSVIFYQNQQMAFVDVVAALRPSTLTEKTQTSNKSLDRVTNETHLDIDNGRVPIPAESKACTLRVVAHPTLNETPASHAPVSLSGFMQLLQESALNKQDLWHFLRDLAKLGRTKEVRYVNLVDMWTIWQRHDKSFASVAKHFDAVVIFPETDNTAWRNAAESVDGERALLALRMHPVSSWPMFTNEGDRAYVAHVARNVTYQVLPWNIPVAVMMTDPHNPFSDRDTVWYLGFAIAMKLKEMKEAFHAAAEMSGMDGLRVDLVRESEDSGMPLRTLGHDGTVLTLGWNALIAAAFLEDPVAAEALIGQVLSESFTSPSARQAFVDSWQETTQWVRADLMAVPKHGMTLPPADRGHSSQLADVRQRLAEHMAASSVQVGMHEGEQAKQLDDEVIYPWALGELHSTLAPYSAEGMLMMAFSQLEMIKQEQILHQHRLGFQREMLPQGVPPESSVDDREELLQHAKAVSLILEETLACPPSGEAPPNGLVWGEMLSLSQVAYISCLRRELICRNLGRFAILVNDAFQIHVEQSDDPTDIDLPAYSRQRFFATLPPPVPLGASTLGQADPQPLLVQWPELTGVNQALHKEKGFGLGALLGVLEVAWEWEITPDQLFGKTNAEVLAAAAAEQIPDVTSEECERAVEWLTLRAEDLRAGPLEHWETSRRAIRIDSRPFVELGSDLCVLPWTALATHKMVGNYMDDGRLPWPYPPEDSPHRADMYLGEGVRKALEKYRKEYCEDTLEKKECYKALSNTHLITVQNMDQRKAKEYGMDRLYGEIDLLSVDTEASRIWVIEAKDPHSPFSMSRVRSAFRQFHRNRGHVGKLLRKVEDIKRNATPVTRYMNIENPDRDWKVQGLMVTRHVHPAAYADHRPVRFCTLDKFADVVVGRDSHGRNTQQP